MYMYTCVCTWYMYMYIYCTFIGVLPLSLDFSLAHSLSSSLSLSLCPPPPFLLHAVGSNSRVQHIPRSLRQRCILCRSRDLHDSWPPPQVPRCHLLCRRLAEASREGGVWPGTESGRVHQETAAAVRVEEKLLHYYKSEFDLCG